MGIKCRADKINMKSKISWDVYFMVPSSSSAHTIIPETDENKSINGV